MGRSTDLIGLLGRKSEAREAKEITKLYNLPKMSFHINVNVPVTVLGNALFGPTRIRDTGSPPVECGEEHVVYNLVKIQQAIEALRARAEFLGRDETRGREEYRTREESRSREEYEAREGVEDYVELPQQRLRGYNGYFGGLGLDCQPLWGGSL